MALADFVDADARCIFGTARADMRTTYSIRGMLLLTTSVAIALAALFVFPDDFASLALLLLNLMFLSTLLSIAIYAQVGRLQAFAIGALVPFVIGAIFVLIYALTIRISYQSMYQAGVLDIGDLWDLITIAAPVLKGCSAMIWAAALVTGFTSLFVRNMVRRGT